MDCSTKSKIRDIPLAGPNAPKPLRSGDLPQRLKTRVVQDTRCSDFVLAVQYTMHRHSRGAFRENPRNSHHWNDPCEKFLQQDPSWVSWDYDACCLFASRRKRQRILHNIEHMRVLPPLVCGHVHDPGEWTPVQLDDGSRFFPSKQEAEYTAHLCFTLVAACSHWAVAQGLAVFKITRMPPMQTSGDWRPLLHLAPEVFRQLAMPALAAFLGLSVVRDAPTRQQVLDLWIPQASLPTDVVYIGHGHFRHRLPCSKWENPFVEGRDGSPHEVLLRYMEWFPSSPLFQQLHELRGMTLACDCSPDQFCHGGPL